METIKDVIMKRDGLTEDEADDLIADAQEDFWERLANDEMPFDLCDDWFGLEPDYIEDLI